ncbi:hypothetical protein [Pseudonocardia alni]|nr:hypothetical protein [Pseudonocardia alni]
MVKKKRRRSRKLIPASIDIGVGTLSLDGHRIVYSPNPDEDQREAGRSAMLQAFALDEKQHNDRYESLLRLMGSVGPFDLLARASAIYASINPDTFKESENNQNPAHIEYLALQCLRTDWPEPDPDLNPPQKLNSTMQALALIQEMFIAEAQNITVEREQERSTGLPDPNLDHVARTRLAALGIRNMAYLKHAEKVIEGCLSPLAERLIEINGFCAQDALDVMHAIPQILNVRSETVQLELAEQVKYLTVELKRARRGRSTSYPIPPELLTISFDKAQFEIRMRALSHQLAGALEISTIQATDIAEVSSVPVARCAAVLEAFTCPTSEYMHERHWRPSGAHPLTQRPIVETDSGYILASPPSMIDAIRPTIENLIQSRSPKLWSSYQKRRAAYLEDAAASLLAGALPGSRSWKNIHWKVTESVKGELDGIVTADTITLRLQCKAGRITDAARRGAPGRMSTDVKKTISDAADQHAELSMQLASNDASALGFSIEQAEALRALFQIEIICTLDDVTVWSTEAHNLRRLGAFKDNVGIPWVVSITDLMVITEMLKGVELAQYVIRRQRMERDGRVSAHDELDWLGHFITEGLYFDYIFNSPNPPHGYRLLSYTEQFDEWYLYEAGFRTVETAKPEIPIGVDLRRLLEKLMQRCPKNWVLATLCILDGDDQTRNEWDRVIRTVYKRSAQRGESDASILLGNGVGVTFIRRTFTSMEKTEQHTERYIQRKLAELEVAYWIGIAEGKGGELRIVIPSCVNIRNLADQFLTPMYARS